MKLKKTFLAGAICVAASSAQASTILQPNSNDVHFDTNTNNYDISIFNKADTAFDNGLDVILGDIGRGNFGGVISFTGSQGTFTATNSIGSTLDLGLTNEFIVAIDADETPLARNWIADSNATYYTIGDLTVLEYQFFSTSEFLNVTLEVGAYDANLSQVPVPAAAWLFASGMLGLAGVARRRA